MESTKNKFVLEFQPNHVETLWKKFNLDNSIMEQSVDILQEWIKKQRHFVSHDFDREYLEKTIYTCKGSLEKAKRQTDRICTLRTLVPKLFISEDIRNQFKELFDKICLVISPKQDKDYLRVVIAKISDKELTAETITNFYKYNTVMCEYLKLYDYAGGYISIIDFRECSLVDVIKKSNPVDIQQILTVLIEGYGALIKGIHMMSHSKLVHSLINNIKPLLSQKIADRIHVHKENEELSSIIDRDLLPVEYGGNERSIYELSDMLFKEISSPEFEAYLVKMKSMSTNESLRLTEKFNEDCVGLPGSFRTLSVD